MLVCLSQMIRLAHLTGGTDEKTGGGNGDGRVEDVTIFIRSDARMDKIRNGYIRGTEQVGRFGEKTREEIMRWYGELRRKDDGYIG